MRVGATRRSPMPAWAGLDKETNGAAATNADTKDLVQEVILTIPTLLRIGAIVLSLVRNG
jgi:hypothetical protein